MNNQSPSATLINKNIEFLSEDINQNFDNLVSRRGLRDGKYELFMSVNKETGTISKIVTSISDINQGETLVCITAAPFFGLDDTACPYRLNCIIDQNDDTLSKNAKEVILNTFSKFNSTE